MSVIYLDRREAAEYLTGRGLKITRNTLQKMATVGGGPIYRVFGIRALYTQVELDDWAASKISAPRTSTSDAAA